MSEDNDYFDEEYIPEEKKPKVESAEERERREVEKVTINMKHNWVRTASATIAVVFGIFFVVWIWMLFWNPVVSMEQQTGYVNEIRCEGRIFKTFEGKLLTYGLLYDSVAEPQTEFYFSVADDSVARELMLLQKSGKKVAVTYKEYDATLPWRGSSTRIVTAVDVR